MKLALDARLTADSLSAAVRALVTLDPDLAGVVDRYGPPPLWARPPGFATLTFIILEQQVSLASARAAFERLTMATSQLTPERFLDLDDAALLAVGFSRQKARYVRGLAHAILDGRLDLPGIDRLEDTAARAALDGPDRDRAVDRGHLPPAGAGPSRHLARDRPRPGDRGPGGQGPRAPSDHRRDDPAALNRGDHGAPWPPASAGTTTSAAGVTATRGRSCSMTPSPCPVSDDPRRTPVEISA